MVDWTARQPSSPERIVVIKDKAQTSANISKSQNSVIKSTVTPPSRPLSTNPTSGVYLLLTSDDVYVQDFCNNVCGFHYFTFQSIVGYTLSYAELDTLPNYARESTCTVRHTQKPLTKTSGVDRMISVIAHEIAELSMNPLVNAWNAG
nr:protein EXORDIUM-like 3 [Ipomoea batatas]